MAKAFDVHLMFVCGGTGFIAAGPDIRFRPVSSAVLPAETGRLVIAETTKGEIKADINLTNHTTTLTVVKTKTPDPMLAKLAIRIPIGVRLFQLVPLPKAVLPAGTVKAFYHETGPGYNTIAIEIKPRTEPQQKVQEIVLVTSHVPPRRDPGALSDADFDPHGFIKLDLKHLIERVRDDKP